MQHSKVLCISCSHYSDCSQQTRMYVNYCGPGIKKNQSKIDRAFAECRSHRGLIYKFQVLNPLKNRFKTLQFDLPVTA